MNKKGVLFSVLAAAAVVSAGVFYFPGRLLTPMPWSKIPNSGGRGFRCR